MVFFLFVVFLRNRVREKETSSSCSGKSWTWASYLMTASLLQRWPDKTRRVTVTHSSGDLDYYMRMSARVHACVCVTTRKIRRKTRLHRVVT